MQNITVDLANREILIVDQDDGGELVHTFDEEGITPDVVDTLNTSRMYELVKETNNLNENEINRFDFITQVSGLELFQVIKNALMYMKADPDDKFYMLRINEITGKVVATRQIFDSKDEENHWGREGKPIYVLDKPDINTNIRREADDIHLRVTEKIDDINHLRKPVAPTYNEQPYIIIL